MDTLQPKVLSVWATWLYPVLVVVHPDTVKVILKGSHTTVPKAYQCKYFLPWLGEGLLISESKRWERNRQLLTPAFHFKVLKPFVKICNDVTQVFTANIRLLTPDAQSIDIIPLVSRVTLDTLLRCTVSYEDEQILNVVHGHQIFCENTEKSLRHYCETVGESTNIQ